MPADRRRLHRLMVHFFAAPPPGWEAPGLRDGVFLETLGQRATDGLLQSLRDTAAGRAPAASSAPGHRWIWLAALPVGQTAALALHLGPPEGWFPLMALRRDGVGALRRVSWEAVADCLDEIP